MDVLLDSNQYKGDPKMEGARFQSLFDYLRRTDSVLVVPRIVRDEVLANYEKDLQAEYSRAVTAIRNLRKTTFALDFPEQLTALDLAGQVRSLAGKLSNPGPGVRSLVAEDYSDVNVQEVARRGILRIKPANDNGEELRDVMVWLATMAYRKRRGSEVAFISNDGDFKDRKDGLHQGLKDELAAEGINISFSSGIEDFLKTHPLAPKKALSAEWATGHLGPDQAGEIGKLFLFLSARSLPFPLVVLSATEPALRFKEGSIYELSPESAYAELEYEGSSTLVVSQPGNRIDLPVLPPVGASLAVTAGQVSAFPVQGLGFNTYDLRHLATAKPVSVPGLQPILGAALSSFIGSTALTTESIPFSAMFTVSLRLEGDKITKLEVYPSHFRQLTVAAEAEPGLAKPQ